MFGKLEEVTGQCERTPAEALALLSVFLLNRLKCLQPSHWIRRTGCFVDLKSVVVVVNQFKP